MRIGGETRLVGLLRHPLRDSLSPPMQNAAFQEAAQGAKVGCPISKALAAVPEITLDATLES